MKNIEIEYKFWLKVFDIKKFLHKNGINYKKVKIIQFYFLQNGDFIRYRKKGKEFFKTIKKGSGLVREEFEEKISPEEFYKRLAKAKNLIKKERFIFEYKYKSYELDRFKKPFWGLIFLEIEFDSLDKAKDFTLPPLFRSLVIKNVTNDDTFSNAYLSKNLSFSAKKNNHNQTDIDPQSSCEDALKKIVYDLLKNIEYRKAEILKNKNDIEQIHQFRVSLRKMKSFLKKFSFLFEKEWVDKRYKNISEILDKTNKKRDFDVFLSYIQKYKKILPNSLKNAFNSFEKYLIQNIINETDTLIKLLQSELLENELKELKNFHIINKEPIFLPFMKIIKNHYFQMQKLHKKIIKKAKKNYYHKMRIKLKEFRYLMEYFPLFFEKRSYEKLIKRVKKFQNILGKYQDIEVQKSYLQQFLKNKKFCDKKSKKAVKFLKKNLQKKQNKIKRKFIKSSFIKF